MATAPSQPLDQAIQLHQAGRIGEAERLFQVVLSADPRNLPALQHLAIIHANRGEFADAQALFRRVLSIDPTSPEAHNNLGRVLSALNRHREAAASFSQALALRPGMVEAAFNLGGLYLKLGQHQSAITHLRQVMQQRPDFSEAVCLLAQALQEQGNSRDAAGLLDEALKRRPRDAMLHQALGRLHASTGELDRASESFEASIALRPDWGVPYYDLSQVHRFTAGDPHISAMERLLANPARLSLDEGVALHLALYRARSDVGDDEAAFAHLAAANAARRSAIGYDEAVPAARRQAIRRVFDAAFIRNRGGQGFASALPIFVVGFPRSGTTLVEQILASHPAVHGAGELAYIGELARGAGVANQRYPESFADAGPEIFSALGAAYIGRLAALAPNATHIVDKMPDNFLHLGLIHLALPQARIIHVRRAAMDTCFSCFENDFGERQPFSYELGELGRRYIGYREMMEHWRRTLPPGRMLEIDYEAIVRDLESSALLLLGHCDLPWDERCLSFHESQRAVFTQSQAQIRRPLYASSLGRWRRYERQLRPLADALGDAAGS